MKNILKWGGIAFLIFFIVYRSDDAANVVGAIGNTLGELASGLGDFVAGVAGSK